MTRFENKTAVVTGGSAGIGLAAAQRLAAEGAHIYITGRNETQLAEAAEQIGRRATPVKVDISVLADLDALYAAVASDGRTIDVLVANAGGGPARLLADVTLEHYDSIVNTNFRGTLFTVQKAMPLVNDNASIILLSSIAAEHGYPSLGVYAATKAAVRSLARTWAAELAGRGIRVNSISPGSIHTGALEAVSDDAEEREAIFDTFRAGIPLGRLGRPDEIGDAIAFLASDESSFVTGTNLFLDGGQGQV